MVGERSATGACADDDDVKMILARHLHPHFLPFPSLLSYLDQIVAAFPGVALRPEKGESNRRLLLGGDRNIDKFNSESGCRRWSILDRMPLVVCPMKTERSRNLDS